MRRLAPKWPRAQAALRVSEANSLELKRREEDVQAHVAEVNRARAQMDITQTQINDTSAYSPIDGVVLVKSAEVGEVLAAGTTVVSIGDLDHPWLRAYVNETDLGRVKLGAPAKLTIDSYPGRTYTGPRLFHRVRGGIHSQADPDQGGARETGLPHQNRCGQSEARAEIQHARGRGD